MRNQKVKEAGRTRWKTWTEASLKDHATAERATFGNHLYRKTGLATLPKSFHEVGLESSSTGSSFPGMSETIKIMKGNSSGNWGAKVSAKVGNQLVIWLKKKNVRVIEKINTAACLSARLWKKKPVCNKKCCETS